MKRIAWILMALFSFSCASKAQEKATGNADAADKKVLVAYFSCTGTTEKVANAIAEATKGKLYRITPATAYTAKDLDWRDKTSRSSVEMKTETSRPELGGEPIDVTDYETIFLGYPIWWDLCPRIVHTFLEKYDFSGKTVLPFATSGGSPIADSVKELQQRYPKIGWQEGKLLNAGAKQAAEWARQTVAKP